MRVKALRVFNDLKGNKLRAIGEEFGVTRERYEEIFNADKENLFVEIIEENDAKNSSGEPNNNNNNNSDDLADKSKSEYPKHIGGGKYELSNGEKLKGKDAAIIAQGEINKSNDKE